MRLFLLRHAIAEEKNLKKWPLDSERPLTQEGAKKMGRAAQGMKEMGLSFDLILTSPFARAMSTAQIVLEVYSPKPPLKTAEALCNNASAADVLKTVPTSLKNVLLVGHEPQMTRLVSELIYYKSEHFPMEFK